VGTRSGLYRWKNGTPSFTFIKAVGENFINCIVEDKNGHIWVGQDYGGLTELDPVSGKPMAVFGTRQGLPNNSVLSLEVDPDGNLWMGTGNGLSKLDISGSTFQNFTTSDGLPGNEFNYRASFQSADGEMYFGGFSGVASFYPRKIYVNRYEAPLVFTGLRLFNTPVSIGGKDGLLPEDISLLHQLRFHYDQDVFTVDFALLNYVKPEKNRYAYKLEGVDKDWTE
jgi:streptogramin lyase